MDLYTLADATLLNSLKQRVRELTSLLDTSQKVYPDALEASQLKHAVAVFLFELDVHGLLPRQVHLRPDETPLYAQS